MVCVGDTLDSQSNETLGQMMLTSYEGTNGQRHQFGCPFVWAEGVPSFDLGDEGAFCLDDVLPTLRGATAEDFAAAERQPETLAAATALTRGLADIVGQRRASAKS